MQIPISLLNLIIATCTYSCCSQSFRNIIMHSAISLYPLSNSVYPIMEGSCCACAVINWFQSNIRNIIYIIYTEITILIRPPDDDALKNSWKIRKLNCTRKCLSWIFFCVINVSWHCWQFLKIFTSSSSLLSTMFVYLYGQIKNENQVQRSRKLISSSFKMY